MRFKFQFETLMRARKARQDEAQRDYRLAVAKVNEQKNKLMQMKTALTEARLEMQTIREGGGKLTAFLVSIEEFLNGQKVRIQNQNKVIKGLDEITEQKRLVLVEAAKELKTLEKLREKRYNEFKTLVRKKELKTLDEVSVMRAARGRDT
jgi:flagellar FliJ protein